MIDGWVLSTDAVEVGVWVFRHVVIEDDVDTLNVHATTEQIGRHQNALLEIFELLVAVQAVNTDTWDKIHQLASVHTHRLSIQSYKINQSVGWLDGV